MCQTPGTGGYKPCLVLLRSGKVVQSSWLCSGGGSNYDKPDAHHFYHKGGQDKIEEGAIIAFFILPQGKHQVEVEL